MTPELETVEHVTGRNPDTAIIWLHGLGADGHDFEPLVDELALSPNVVRYVFPHAPVRPVTLNGGLPMRAWFDVRSLTRDAAEDVAGIAASTAAVDALVTRERARGVPAGRIVLAGFSQGGAIALHCGIRIREPLAGIVALSTYVPLAERLELELNPERRQAPIFMAHGAYDPIVAPTWGELSRDALLKAGFKVTWRSYPMAHAVCGDEIADLAAWLRARLDAPPALDQQGGA